MSSFTKVRCSLCGAKYVIRSIKAYQVWMRIHRQKSHPHHVGPIRYRPIR